MRLAPVWVAVAILLAISDFVVAGGDAKSTNTGSVKLMLSTGHRFLRPEIKPVEVNLGEERFLDSLLQQASTFISKLAKLNPWRIADESKLSKMYIKQEKAYNDIYGVFKTMEEKKWNPGNLGNFFKIEEKIKMIPPDKLKDDQHYLLWIQFRDYWIKFHPESQPSLDIFKKMESDGMTPLILKERFDISKKIRMDTHEGLMYDGEYVMFIRFVDYMFKRGYKVPTMNQASTLAISMMTFFLQIRRNRSGSMNNMYRHQVLPWCEVPRIHST